MKKIIINGKFLSQKVTGVQRFARELVAALDGILSEKDDVEIAVPPETANVPKYQNIKVTAVGKLHQQMWEHISFPGYVKKQKGISLNLCNIGPISNPGIVCIHDMKIKAHPEYFSKKFLLWYDFVFKNNVKKSLALLTVSEFSRDEIMKYYSVPKEKIHIINNAWQHYSRVGYDENALSKYKLEKDSYYFGMSSLEPNKNFKWIAEAAKANPNSVFAIAGSINEKIFSDGLGFPVPGNMKLLGYVSDEEAKTLMRDCKAFMFPSFYEGFGIPPLEAAAAGANQVIVSDIPVMHELFENHAWYVNPERYEALPEIKKDMHLDEALKKYSWHESAVKLLQLVKKF